MQRILAILVVLGSLSLCAASNNAQVKTTRGEVKIIEATENIRYLSQKIAKEYLFFYKYPTHTTMKSSLYDTLKALSLNLQNIASVTNDPDTNNILEFLAYSKEEILNLLKKDPTYETAILMLDYSETLLEGADSIGRTYAYSFSKEEEMLVASKNVSFLLERMMKYYMALYCGDKSQNNQDSLHKSMKDLHTYLAKLNAYDYPHKIEAIKQKINVVWKRDKQIIEELDQYFIPLLLSDSVVYMENSINTLAMYHSKNL